MKEVRMGLEQGMERGWCDCIIYGVFVLSSFPLPKIIVQTENSGRLLGHVWALFGWC